MNNYLVTKSNSLIEARYKLTLEEQRFMLYLVSMVQPKDNDFCVYTISIKEFMNLLDVKNKSVYRQFKDMSEHLMSKPLIIKKEGSTLIMNWLSSAEYYSGQGKIELTFDPKLKPYLLKLKENFTSYKLKNVISLRSFYSIRIYELLKQYERLNERTITLKELREYLGIDNDFYPMYSNFKQKVLNVAYHELKEKADICFKYEEIKAGKKVDKIKFIIHKNENRVKEESADESVRDATFEQSVVQMEDAPPLRKHTPRDIQQDLNKLREIIQTTLTDSELMSIYKAARGDVPLIARRYKEARSQRQLNNLVGFMVWACRESDNNFRKTAVRGKSKYSNYSGRDWDFEELERKRKELLLKEIAAMKDSN